MAGFDEFWPATMSTPRQGADAATISAVGLSRGTGFRSSCYSTRLIENPRSWRPSGHVSRVTQSTPQQRCSQPVVGRNTYMEEQSKASSKRIAEFSSELHDPQSVFSSREQFRPVGEFAILVVLLDVPLAEFSNSFPA